jgi:hypothetical protein
VATADIVQVAVVALGDDRVDRRGGDADGRVPFDRPADQCVGHLTDAQRIRQQDRALQLPQFGDLHQADRLAIAVEDLGSGGDFAREEIVAVRQDGGHAGANRADPAHQRSRTAPDGGVTDQHARHIGDRVGRAGRQHPRHDAEIARPHPFCRPHRPLRCHYHTGRECSRVGVRTQACGCPYPV